ncbi:hypothetical protein Dsin_019337, partial [Dipteronia sinensis]
MLGPFTTTTQCSLGLASGRIKKDVIDKVLLQYVGGFAQSKGREHRSILKKLTKYVNPKVKLKKDIVRHSKLIMNEII